MRSELLELKDLLEKKHGSLAEAYAYLWDFAGLCFPGNEDEDDYDGCWDDEDEEEDEDFEYFWNSPSAIVLRDCTCIDEELFENDFKYRIEAAEEGLFNDIAIEIFLKEFLEEFVDAFTDVDFSKNEVQLNEERIRSKARSQFSYIPDEYLRELLEKYNHEYSAIKEIFDKETNHRF